VVRDIAQSCVAGREGGSFEHDGANNNGGHLNESRPIKTHTAPLGCRPSKSSGSKAQNEKWEAYGKKEDSRQPFRNDRRRDSRVTLLFMLLGGT